MPIATSSDKIDLSSEKKTEELARKSLKLAGYKLSVKTKFVTKKLI